MRHLSLFLVGCLAGAGGIYPLWATVRIQSLTPSASSPQPLGTVVTWTVKATDTASDNLTFQFNVAAPNGAFAMVRDFNIGTLSAGVWAAQFPWATIAGEGSYTVQVIARDFITGESDTQSATFQLRTLVAGGAPAVHRTMNPLVAIYSAPACDTGSSMRVAFFAGTQAPTFTAWVPCKPTVSMNFYIAGMLPSSTYAMYSETATNGKIVRSANLNFTTGALPKLASGSFPSFTVKIPAAAGDPNPMLLWAFTKSTPPVATDLNGNINWFYPDGGLMTRPVSRGTVFIIHNGPSWNSTNTTQQLLREIDLAGNIVHETNTGAISQQLVAMGVTDATACGQIARPPQVGDVCLNDFHHEAIRYSIGGQPYTAFLAHLEKLFPAGTQGHPGSSPVDVLSEILVVLDANWRVVWYFNTFDQLDIQRAAPLGETCLGGSSDCPTNLFLSKMANDWTHANTIDYVAAGPGENPDSGDFLLSIRNQDWVIKIAYNNGAGSCSPPPAPACIKWYMGPTDGLPVPPNSFTFDNLQNDPWPWFSHQHDVTYANNGARSTVNGLTGPLLTLYDNGNTRYASPPLGLGSACAGPPNDCYSRGMALIVDEANMEVTPVLVQNLGLRTTALGSAQVLSNITPNNYFFGTGFNTYVPVGAIEIAPVAGVDIGKIELNVQGSANAYRVWQMPDLYHPPDL